MIDSFPIWRLRFVGRPVGAIGISWEQAAYVSAVDEKTAWINLYERFEDIYQLAAHAVDAVDVPEGEVVS